MSLESRIWRRVRKTRTCWSWTGAKFKTGYAQIAMGRGRSPQRVHRLVYQLKHGPIPRRLDVMHRCDVRHCVRLSHLRLGTRKQNMEDAVRKGRTPRGVKNGHAKITELDVRRIRRRHLVRGTQRALAREFGLCEAEISNILRRKTWKHVRS